MLHPTALVAVLVVAVATAAAGRGPHGLPPGTKINCAKAKANYCLEDNIILHCDDDALGVPAFCEDKLSGQLPASAPALCYQSSPEAGDAACMKNCVVYADSSSYTLPRDKCQPNHPVRSLPRPVEEDLHPGVDRKPTTGSEGLCSDCTARAPPTTPVSGTQSKRSSPVMTAGAAANTGAGLGAIALAAVVAVVVAHVDES